MSEHLQPAELLKYRERRFAPAALSKVDAHLASCAACRASLMQKPDLIAARRMLRAVERAAPHLSYEQLEARVDGKLGAAERIAFDAHLAACPRCARELAEMRSYAQSLSQRPAILPAPRRPILERLQAWLGGAMALRAVTAGLVVAVAATVVLSSGVSPFGTNDRGTESASDAIRASKPSDVAGPSPATLPVERDAFDRSIFDRLGEFAPETVVAYRAGEYASVANMLRIRADRGNASARSALALLLAEGRGVTRDTTAAEKLWMAAMKQGEASAARNLAILRERERTVHGSYGR